MSLITPGGLKNTTQKKREKSEWVPSFSNPIAVIGNVSMRTAKTGTIPKESNVICVNAPKTQSNSSRKKKTIGSVLVAVS